MSTDSEENDTYPRLVHAAPPAPEAARPARKPNGQYNPTFSGNPKGRPKKIGRAWSRRQFAMDILSEANREVPVTVDGKIEHISMYALIMRQLILKGAKGDIKAAKMAIEEICRAQMGRESKHWQFFKDLEEVERVSNQPSINILETKTPEMLAAWRKWSRKV